MPTQRIKIDISARLPHVHKLVEVMCNQFCELPPVFYPPICEMIYYAAANDSKSHQADFYMKLFQFGLNRFCSFLDTHTTYIEIRGVATDKVLSITSSIPDHFTWTTENEMEDIAEMLADTTIDMMHEFTLVSDRYFMEIVDEIDFICGDNHHKFDIDLSRKYITVTTITLPFRDITHDRLCSRTRPRSQSHYLPRLG